MADKMGMKYFAEFKIPFPGIRFDAADDIGRFERLHRAVKGAFVDFGIEGGVLLEADGMLLLCEDRENFFARSRQPQTVQGYFFIERHFDKTS